MTQQINRSAPGDWPDLPLGDWADTCATLHLWTQIVGKIRLAYAPMINHWWQVPLYVNCRGLTTSSIPHAGRSFQIDLDFIDHVLKLQTSKGETEVMVLRSRTVADFYQEIVARLHALGLDTPIWTMPVEIPDAIPFEQDSLHAAYDPEYATRFWRILIQADRVLNEFRARFLGKVSPVHFFWGSFDLAVTRFSGRNAPQLNGASPNLGAWVMQEAYSHEVSSCGFWPGNGGFGEAAFYCYAYPEPQGFSAAPVRPEQAFYDPQLGQFLLPYSELRRATSPDALLIDFLQTTYEAAANLAQWDRASLERVNTSPVVR